jgi:hypothetical protein
MMSTLARRLYDGSIRINGCRIWLGRKDKDGYGRIKDRGSDRQAHICAYELARGLVPAGLQLDHLCRNRACIDAEHLEAVTCRVNLMRGHTQAAMKAAQTHCVHGHEFTPENTYSYPGKRRMCRRCAIERTQQRRRESLV